MRAPKLSVVMATFNRAETIVKTLRHLNEQTLAPEDYEVIVVDDGSPDRTAEAVAECRQWLRFELRFMSHSNRGPGYTQNRGLSEARAPLALLMADDIFLAPEALRSHVKAHELHAEPEVAVLGRVLQSPELEQSVFLRTWDPFKFRELEGYEELPYYYFWACNISFKTEFMRTFGMFRDQSGRAGAAAHEDVELGYRLSRKGLRIVYCKEALGYHFHIETLEGALKRAFQRGLNWDEFRNLVPEPEIPVRYHVLALDTLRDHIRAFSGPRRRFLMGPDRNPLMLAVHYALRGLLFNAFVVDALWLPLTRAAERSPLVARLMHRRIYRGVISQRFLAGRRDAIRRYGPSGSGVSERS